jgi:hypothetical protein
MNYRSNGVSKFDYACYLAAALAYIMLNQQDLVGLVTFSDGIRRQLPPRSSPGHLRAVIDSLEQTEPSGDTDLGRTLHHIASQLKRRGLVILLSDLLDEPTEVLQGLRHLRYQKHEVLVFHLLDHDEIAFPFTQLTQFEDLEDKTRVITDPRAIAVDYQEQIQQFIKDYETMCRRQSIDYTLFNTRTPLDKGLSSTWLARCLMGWLTFLNPAFVGSVGSQHSVIIHLINAAGARDTVSYCQVRSRSSAVSPASIG